MRLHFILHGKVAVPCAGLVEYANWYESADRTVGKDKINDTTISTVFLGMNHEWRDDMPPLLFETMLFCGASRSVFGRCSTWEQAEAMHAEAVASVKPI